MHNPTEEQLAKAHQQILWVLTLCFLISAVLSLLLCLMWLGAPTSGVMQALPESPGLQLIMGAVALGCGAGSFWVRGYFLRKAARQPDPRQVRESALMGHLFSLVLLEMVAVIGLVLTLMSRSAAWGLLLPGVVIYLMWQMLRALRSRS